MCTPIQAQKAHACQMSPTPSLSSLGYETIQKLGEGDPSLVFLIKNEKQELFAAKRYRAQDEWASEMPQDWLE